ncbi:OmpP1/FadL family transporter [Vibrio methylphosphonaticus]|uniref:OmpP1/FadL family transporter n=1 Tax=Vibrio methylphosphonaticus TaxID=2946866 RepID=UPI00202A198F|nr:outer membrane protein transport protein [Vibrio methylphosphonaticus]MCL9777358.1 outer membrane protein transport protein [Vibrio methylphosphonaticus]
MKKTNVAVALLTVFASSSFAGGILLHEVATFDSVSSAGVGNASNRIDASAAITSPAGLTAITDSSLSVGAQYLDAYTEHNGTNNGGGSVTSNGKTRSLVPSLAYGQRVSDSWVLAASLHGDGGLGMDYSGGLIGYDQVNSISQEALNLQLAAGYQASDNLSLGGAVVVQHLMTSIDSSANAVIDNEGNSTAASFMLSAMYDLSESTFLSANYKHRVKHDLSDIGVSGTDARLDSATWPSRFDLGVQHKISEQLTFKAMTGVELWSDFDDKANDVYSVGTALAYSQSDWTYQAGVRYDSTMYDVENMTPALPIGANWSLGLGAEKARSNGDRIGIAYQYRHMGTQDVNYAVDTPVGSDTFTGSVDTNRIHVISVSYAY